MIEFEGRGLLLDIEGTTSSIAFVHDVLFPYARRELHAFAAAHWQVPEVRAACRRIAEDAGITPPAAERPAREQLCATVIRLMDQDAKATGLKMLQGLIWRRGYDAGELRAQVYPDVPPALQRWTAAGLDIRIYSSGSVQAQHLFFAHTDHGDLTGLLHGYYDTVTGPKRAADSYRTIVGDMALPPEQVLFLSDVPGELDAAAAAGLHTALVQRPGNHPVDACDHPIVTSFDQIR